MTIFLEILHTYEDFELAFILKYRASEYMPDTKQKIVDELRKRGVDNMEKVDQLIQERHTIPKDQLDKNACVFCTSTKTYTQPQEYMEKHGSYDYKSDREVTIAHNPTCSVCGSRQITKKMVEEYEKPLLKEWQKTILVAFAVWLFLALLKLLVR